MANTNKKSTAELVEKAMVSGHSILMPGTPVLIRTAVYHWSGRVRRILDIGGVAFVELTEAAWQADTGPYSDGLKRGTQETSQSEIEPVPEGQPALIQIASIGDVVLHPEPLPNKQK